MILLKHNDKLNDVIIALTLPAFREVLMEFIKKCAMVLRPIAIALDRLQSDKFCFYECLLPILLTVKKKLNRLNANELGHCKALLNAVIKGYDRYFSKFLQLDLPSSSKCKAAVLAAVSNPQFKLKWLRPTIKCA